MPNEHIIAVAKLLTAAVAELDAAKAVVADAPAPAYATRDVRFERVDAARREVEDQLRNIRACCYFDR